jgi:hypothetical protein
MHHTFWYRLYDIVQGYCKNVDDLFCLQQIPDDRRHEILEADHSVAAIPFWLYEEAALELGCDVNELVHWKLGDEPIAPWERTRARGFLLVAHRRRASFESKERVWKRGKSHSGIAFREAAGRGSSSVNVESIWEALFDADE